MCVQIKYIYNDQRLHSISMLKAPISFWMIAHMQYFIDCTCISTCFQHTHTNESIHLCVQLRMHALMIPLLNNILKTFASLPRSHWFNFFFFFCWPSFVFIVWRICWSQEIDFQNNIDEFIAHKSIDDWCVFCLLNQSCRSIQLSHMLSFPHYISR